MYKCEHCGRVFDEPDIRHDTYESYCGVGSLFPDSHGYDYNVCPHCGSEDFDEFYEEEEDV